jgi:hypothetical protein
LALRLRRSVAFDDPQLRLLVHTPHHAETVDHYRVHSIMQKAVDQQMSDWVHSYGIAKAVGPTRIPGRNDLAVIARVCVPVRCQQILLGYLWLLDPDGSLSDADLALATEAADAAGQILFRQQLLGDLERGRGRELLRDLLAPDDVVREHAAHQLVASDRLPEAARVTVLVVRVDPAGDADREVLIDVALQRGARRLAPLATLTACRGGVTGVLVVGARTPPARDALRDAAVEMHAALTSLLGPGESAHVGIGPTVSDVSLTHDSYRYASDAIRVATRVPGFGPVAAWDALGIYRLLVQFPADQIRDSALPAGLLELRDSDESGVLVETLEVYLDEAGNVPATIDRLNVHRSTLYYRLDRIEKSTGMSLRNGQDRLALHIGVKFGRLTGLLPT